MLYRNISVPSPFQKTIESESKSEKLDQKFLPGRRANTKRNHSLGNIWLPFRGVEMKVKVKLCNKDEWQSFFFPTFFHKKPYKTYTMVTRILMMMPRDKSSTSFLRTSFSLHSFLVHFLKAGFGSFLSETIFSKDTWEKPGKLVFTVQNGKIWTGPK